MLKLKKVAVTGGLSCGKSSVCRIFKELGAYVIHSDDIVHQLLSSDPHFARQVIALLGPDIIVDQKIDRQRIAQLVFNDKHLLWELEQLIHPIVYTTIEKDYQTECQHCPLPSLFVAEVPLLFESGGQKQFDCSITVVAPRELCWQRFHAKTGKSIEEFEQRMQRQLPLEEKYYLADYRITNQGSLADLKERTQAIYCELTKSSK